MPSGNNLNSLYSFNNNVSVSSNNFTTLYSPGVSGNVTTGVVADRNFTTLYTKQSDIQPTRPYGNSNVQAFLNVGSDYGGNQVQNIVMSGDIHVGGESYLGPVGNVHIEGGTYNYVLITDGTGNLSWAEQQTLDGNTTPYIHFDVGSTGNNQSFSNSLISTYSANNLMSVFKNGVNIEPFYYTIVGDTLTMNILLNTGDTVDILPSGGGGGGAAAGNNFEVQFNGGGLFSANSDFTFDPVNALMTTTNANFTGNVNFADVSNVFIPGGSANYVLTTDGNGNVSWANVAAGVPNYANFAGTAFSVTGSNVSGTVANANYATYSGTAFSVSASNVSGLGNIATINLTGSTSNVLYGNGVFAPISVNSVANANYANYAGNAFSVNGANVSGQVGNALVAGTVYTSAQPNITSTGTLTDLTIAGNLIIQRGYEKFTTVGTGATGTINFDALTQSILYYSANASANCTLNIRGNSTVTLDTILPTNDTLTVVFLNTVGSTAYIANTIQIDGSTVIPKFVNGTAPNVGIRLANAQQSYTLTIMKTAGNTYNVLGSLTEYQ
jgi:hypothetical protein